MRSGRGVRQYVVTAIQNPVPRINEVFPAYENLRHPRCQQLRTRYRLNTTVRGETDEFRRILLLRHWIKQHLHSTAPPAPSHEDIFSILDTALKGGEFHPSHFSLVQQAVLTSFGYVTRRLGAGPGLNEPGQGGHYGINEVWVNSLCKWVLVDAKYNCHFERDGLPLSALEIRDELLVDGAQSVRRAIGPERRLQRKTLTYASTYRWMSWETTPRFTDFPNHSSSNLVVYEDEFLRANTWYRSGKPHWAYAADSFLPVRHREWIEWTPNVIGSRTTIEGDRAQIVLRSSTPNFRAYQLRRGRGVWRECDDRLNLKIGATGLELTFRTVNLADVTGPEHRVRIVPAE